MYIMCMYQGIFDTFASVVSYACNGLKDLALPSALGIAIVNSHENISSYAKGTSYSTVC